MGVGVGVGVCRHKGCARVSVLEPHAAVAEPCFNGEWTMGDRAADTVSKEKNICVFCMVWVAGAGQANLFVRTDQVWGIEWWGRSLLNFWVRDPNQANYRAVQASVCPVGSAPGRRQLQDQAACARGWVRVAMTYDTTKPFADAIAMYARGEPLKPTGAAPGNSGGALANSTAGLESSGLPGVALADLVIYGGAMPPETLASVTAAAVPPPAPAPPAPPTPPPPPPPPPAPDLPRGWPMNNFSDAWPYYYSFNPHGHDPKGPNGTTRRLMFGWIPGDTSAAVKAGRVPYWDSAHSMMRTLTVSGASLVQLPAGGTFEPLRASPQPRSFGPMDVTAGKAGFLPGISGDAFEARAVFLANESTTATSFGLAFRVSAGGGFACRVGYSPATQMLSAPGIPSWRAAVTSQPAPGVVALHIFLDRSILETYARSSASQAFAHLRCVLGRRSAGAGAAGR